MHEYSHTYKNTKKQLKKTNVGVDFQKQTAGSTARRVRTHKYGEVFAFGDNA